MAGDPKWLKATVGVITRLVYFLIGFFGPVFLVGAWTYHRYHTPLVGIWAWHFLGPISIVTGILAAVFGPYLYRIESTRGLGELGEIRKRSKGPVFRRRK